MARIGNQHPTQKRFLPYEDSLFQEAVDIYQRTERACLEWQSELLKPIMATNEDDLWVHTKFGYSVPRRNGKNEILGMRELWGLLNGEKILHTAHRTTASHTAWERLLAMLDEAEIKHTSLKATGREQIDVKETGGRIEFRTRSTKGGLGEGFDLLVIDEAQEYTDDQESALKYVVSSSKNPQTIFCGTPPTPLSSGTVFTKLRNTTMQGETENAGWAEWSVSDESDPTNKDLWYKTNPSLGVVISERSVGDELGSDIIDFNIQRLGLWIKYNQKSAISKNDWEALKIESMPKLKGKLFVGIKFGRDGANVAMSIAAKTTDGKVFVESLDCQSVRNGRNWITTFLTRADVEQIVIDGASGQNLLANDLKDARVKVKPILPTVKEVINANASFEQGVFSATICHAGQPSLHQVVTNCEKRAIGTSGGFGYNSQFDDFDISLLDSVILAHWACVEAKPKKGQRITY